MACWKAGADLEVSMACWKAGADRDGFPCYAVRQGLI